MPINYVMTPATVSPMPNDLPRTGPRRVARLHVTPTTDTYSFVLIAGEFYIIVPRVDYLE